MRLLPRTIANQTILLLALGLTLSHAVSMLAYAVDRSDLLAASGGREFAHRAATAVDILEAVPADWRARIVEAADASDVAVFLDPENMLTRDIEPDWRGRLISALLAEELGPSYTDQVIIQVIDRQPSAGLGHITAGSPTLVRASVQLSDGAWVTVAGILPHSDLSHSAGAMASLAVMLVAVVVLSILAVRRITKPLRTLADAAERLGRDVNAPPLTENGPQEVRRAAHAFNVMQNRLRRFVEDRTQMLAAISHDLRTPITLLRLRAEFIEDEEERTKTLATLEEMESMIGSTLAFARDDALREEAVDVDVGALVDSLCEDLAETGAPIRCTEALPVALHCRPMALRRAVSNLVGNAVRYGESATVKVEADETFVRIVVDDDGPGLPEDELDAVFRPFYRVEKSRSRESGGVGLGLSVVRTVAHLHGGEILLVNRPEGGLRATLILPRGTAPLS